jgi:hypothetical protein
MWYSARPLQRLAHRRPPDPERFAERRLGPQAPGGSCSVTIISSSMPKACSERLLFAAGALGDFLAAGVKEGAN